MTNKKSNYFGSGKRLRKCRTGVSEIIGNLLILAITVSLFSGVLFFVTNMPSPQDQTLSDFSAQTGISGSNLYMNITHKGGQSLSNDSTNIYLFKNNDLQLLYISSDPKLGNVWNIGGVWSHILSNFDKNSDSVRIMVVDKTTNNIVWQATLAGNANNNFPPIIGSRGINPMPAYDGDLVKFYATVVDVNGLANIASVYMNAAFLPGVTNNHVVLWDSNNDGIFTSNLTYKASYRDWNGQTVFFNATNRAGATSSVQFTLSVMQNQSGNNIDNNGGSGSGSPPGNLDYSGLQGFQIFEWSDWNLHKYSATPTLTFDKGQTAVVVIASKFVVNVQNMNSILVMNDTTKQVQSGVSSPINSFQPLDVLSGYYIYNCSINTSLLPSLTAYYLLDVKVKDNWNPNNAFMMNQMILIKTAGASVTQLPTFTTYSDSSFTKKTTSFTTYNTDSDVVYVEITTKIGGAWVPGSGLVEIRDFFWDSQLSNTPPSDSPYPPTTYYSQHVTHWTGSVSNVWQSAVNKYRFEINLYNVTGLTPWLPGFNAYILKYDMFQAGTETYVLSNVINVTSPTTKLDIVAGGEPQGGARFQSQASLLYYKNDNSWYPPLMLETTTDKKSYNPVISIIRAGDINGDGKTDFVAVEDDGGTNLYLFIQRSSGGFDKYWISSISGTASDVQLGNTGLGKTLDIVVGYASGAVTLYKNDGIWSKYTVVGSGSPVSSIQVANMVPPGSSGVDINRSMDIVVGRTDGTITVFKNQNGIGTLWNPIKLSSSTTTTQDFAIGEDSTNDIITGSYLDTTSAIQVPWIYEEVQEQLTMRHQISVPAAPKGVLDNCPDDISQLQYANSASNPYTVAGGSNASIVNWDGTGLINDLPTSQVTFEVMYKTNGNNDGTDYITWSNETGKIETSSNMINIQNTEGGWVRASYDLTSKFPLASSLKTLNITYENSNPLSTSVDFRYWSLNVTWVTGDIMDHNWTVKVPSSGSTYAFSAFALRSASNDGDKIEFNYSIDNGLTFKSFSTHLYVGVGSSFTQYSGIITGVTSTGIIKIKASAPWIKTATPGESYLKIGQMTVTTVGATVTSVGTSIAALTVADMNGDGANDIVAIGGSGTLVAFMNCAGSSIFDHPSSPYSTGISNALDIGAGNFFNPYKGKYLDIAVSTATGVYLINQNKTTPGTYDAKFALLTGQSIVKMIAADVDGNGRTDILLATSSAICYYANYQGLKTQGWQYYVVDNQIIGSGGINDLDARKFQTY